MSFKYIALVLRADNRGEGGILALMALAFPERDRARETRRVWLFTILGLFGAALLYGDGLITPAITVLSAVEGLEVATPMFKPYTVPLAVGILGVLFGAQRFGTGGVGRVFGRVMLVWFATISALGVREVVRAPEVLEAVLPHHAFRFFLDNGWRGFHVLGSVFLVLTMIITTCLFFFTARRLWSWNPIVTGVLCAVFLGVELVFLGANLIKLGHGGAFPLVIGLLGLTVMSTWKTGRARLRQRLARSLLPIQDFLKSLLETPPLRVRGTAVFLSGNPEGTPLALMHNLKHNKTLHERVVLLTVLIEDVPYVDEERRVDVTSLGQSFYRVIGRYGFMEEPVVPEILARCKPHGLNLREMETTYFLSRETVIVSKCRGLAPWRKNLFALMSRNAQSATAYYGLPANRVVELGMQIEI